MMQQAGAEALLAATAREQAQSVVMVRHRLVPARRIIVSDPFCLNFSARVFFFSQYIYIEVSNAGFGLNKRNIYTDFIAQQLKILWFGKPIMRIPRSFGH